MELKYWIIIAVCVVLIILNIVGIIVKFPFTPLSFWNLITRRMSCVDIAGLEKRAGKDVDGGYCEVCGHILLKDKELKRCDKCYAKLAWVGRRSEPIKSKLRGPYL